MKAFFCLLHFISSSSAVFHHGSTNSQHPLTATNGPAVHVKNGTLIGVHSREHNQDLFLGVPYAKPPIESLRFRNPQSLDTAFDGSHQATTHAPACVGYGTQIGFQQSEDCLYINVIRPSGYDEDSLLPIGVFIHGGGLSEGTTMDERYSLSHIVQNSVKIGKPIIGVSIAYRLSGWGFLQSKEVTESGNTNLGLRDQRLALHWIRENIKAFSGDPEQVTIWGDSAGAGSVGWHLTAYNGRDDHLFRAGIMQSGNPINYGNYWDEADYQPYYESITKSTGCSTAHDTLDCLRKAPFDDLNRAISATIPNLWMPIIDGDFIQRRSSLQLFEGAFVKVPIIVGANTDEGTTFTPTPITTVKDFSNQIQDKSPAALEIQLVHLPEHLVPDVLRVYPDSAEYWIPSVEEVGQNPYPPAYGAQYRRSAAFFGDATMIANRRGACETWTNHDVPAYCYRFNTLAIGEPALGGVAHSQDILFVFDNLHCNEQFSDIPASHKTLAKLMSSSWIAFIHDLDPNSFDGRQAKTPVWPCYNLEEPQNMVWDARVDGLAFTEPDTWRKEGIQWILDHAEGFQR